MRRVGEINRTGTDRCGVRAAAVGARRVRRDPPATGRLVPFTVNGHIEGRHSGQIIDHNM